MSKVIALVGFIGSGKGTVGDFLQRLGFEKESFARPLKDATSIIFNWPRDMVEGATAESRAWRDIPDEFWSEKLGRSFTPRLALQLMGTEAGREVFGENLWTSALINRLDPKKNYVITDARFDNEIKAIRDIGGVTVRVKRGLDPDWFPLAQEYLVLEKDSTGKPYGYAERLLEQLPHRSEWDWANSPMDFTITNDGTLEELKQKVYTL